MWLLSASLLSVWNQRQATQKVQPNLTRADLEAKVNLLRQTRYENVASNLDEKIQVMFRYIESY